MEDKLSRKLTDLRISVTDRCNFRCRYCMPEELYGEAYEFLSRDQVLSFEEIVRLTKIFIKLGINKIRLTGGEPLVRKNIEELISLISRLDKNIDLAMTTNGYLLNKFSNILFSSGLRRLTISLDSLDNDIFQKMSGKKFSVEDILKGISSAKEAGFKNIKINSVSPGPCKTKMFPHNKLSPKKSIPTIEKLINLSSKGVSGEFFFFKKKKKVIPSLKFNTDKI